MMPLERVSRIRGETELLIEQSKRELVSLRETCFRLDDYNWTARRFLETATWQPESRCPPAGAGDRSALQVVRSDAKDWRERAQETRLLAERVTEPRARRAMIEIADGYDRLGGADFMLEPYTPVRPGPDLAAAA